MRMNQVNIDFPKYLTRRSGNSNSTSMYCIPSKHLVTFHLYLSRQRTKYDNWNFRVIESNFPNLENDHLPGFDPKRLKWK